MSPTCEQCGLESPSGMRFCGGCGRPLVAADPAGGAQRRHMTVMFCDMVGSTPLADSLDPEDFRELLRAYQHACAEVVERYDGWIAQWAGDGLVAYFGYPRVHEDDAQRAVHAGLAIVEAMVSLSAGLDAALQVRIGLHSGLVIAGESGTGAARLERAAVGATPHVAARLEGIATPGTVVISDATRELVDGYFDLEPLGERELKGVARPIGVYRVRRFTGAVGRLDVAGRRALRPMVGRDAELARLQGAWRRATEGLGAHRARARRGGHRQEPADPRADRARSAVRRSGSARPTTAARRCTRSSASSSARSTVPSSSRAPPSPRGSIPARPCRCCPACSPARARTGPAARRSPAARRRCARSSCCWSPIPRGIRSCSSSRTSIGPIRPRSSCSAGSRRGCASAPVLCVATYRREFEPPWPCELCIELGPLSPEDVRAMAGPDVDLSAADGVPLFVEELLKSLGDGEERRRARDPARPADAAPRAAPGPQRGDRRRRGARPRVRARAARGARAARRRARAAHRPRRDPAGRAAPRAASSSPTPCCGRRPTRACCDGAGRRCTRASPGC